MLYLDAEEKEIRKKDLLMARVSEKNAEEIYITDDNPRNENPKLIRQMIISGFKKKKKFIIYLLRTKL